jgi:hypothetical protein
MSNKINKIAQAIFIYLEDIGPCEVSVSCYADNVENVGNFQPTVLFNGESHIRNKKVPMIQTFRNFFIEYTKQHMGDLLSRIDYDINDYHELVFRIYPEEKKMDIKGYSYYIEYTQKNFKEETPGHITEMMNDEKVRMFRINFWGGHDDYAFDYNSLQGKVDPGFVRQFEDYFENLLDEKQYGWASENGSEGTFDVDRVRIDIELNLKDEEFRYSGFHKEIKL